VEEVGAVALLLVVGALLAVQAAANVQLSAAVRSPLGASTLQLGIGLALMCGAAVAAGSVGAFGRIVGVPPWHLLGGLGSAVYITAGIVLFPRLGALVTVGLFITGQMAASLVLDTFGLLGVPVEPVDAAGAVGAVAVLVGAGLVVRAQSVVAPVAVGAHRGNGTGPDRHPHVAAVPVPSRVGRLALGVVGGAVLPVQGAVNAALRADVGTSTVVAAVSFLVATAAMAVVLIIAVAVVGAPRPQLRQVRGVPWWGWSGGLVGAVYVTSVFLLVPQIGAASTVALTVGGQQLAGAVVDRYGLLRLPRREIPTTRLIGVGVLLAGVGLLQLT
jgi:transporter family-2 protein